jgi:hypothetical protein
MIVFRRIILTMRNVSDKSRRENQNPPFMHSKFFPKNRAVYEIMWKNNKVEPDRPQMTILRMRFACWITKATDTHRITNTSCFSTPSMVTWTRLNVTFIRKLRVFFNVKPDGAYSRHYSDHTTHARQAGCLISGMGGKFFSPSQRSHQLEAYPVSYSAGTEDSFPSVKWPRPEADHSPPSIAEVKNEWSSTSTPYMLSWRA